MRFCCIWAVYCTKWHQFEGKSANETHQLWNSKLTFTYHIAFFKHLTSSCRCFTVRPQISVIGPSILFLLWLIAGVWKYRLDPGSNGLVNMYSLKGGPLPDANYNKLFSPFRNKSEPKIPPVQVKRCLLISEGISVYTWYPALVLRLNTCLELCIKFLHGLFA